MDIRQLIEHAFQKLKFVTLYEMDQPIINTYTSYIAYYDISVQEYQQYFAD